MITKNAAVEAILKEAIKSLMERAASGKLQAGDVQLLESLWRCSFTNHSKYDREAVTNFATIINYGGTAPTMHKDDDKEQYEYVIANAMKWIVKWDICPKITEKLQAAAAKEKAAKEAAEAKAKEAEKKAKAAEAAKKETADAQKKDTDAKATA